MILVVNAGSSSIKFALFGPDLAPRLTGLAAGIGSSGFLEIDGARQDQPLVDHRAALGAVLAGLEDRGIVLSELVAAAHRVVHGGRKLTRPVRITPEILAEISACSPLAPLHNPHNLAAIETLSALAPEGIP